ncbi:hypothetical protein ACJMK2_013365 [Sinanodonta woodiana]|uniref:Uncharacterized protein n=1 Tax=Sinanodonta woodiana TaxID=1069815 RepID=A0ABD3UY86_SINWO
MGIAMLSREILTCYFMLMSHFCAIYVVVFGALEVKCPRSIRFSDQKVVRPCYVDDGVLKRNHTYYMQIQGVMAISGSKWCDFYLYTTKGHNQERVPFDPEFWEGVKPKLVHFFTKYVAPRLLCNAAICNEKTLPCLQKIQRCIRF